MGPLHFAYIVVIDRIARVFSPFTLWVGETHSWCSQIANYETVEGKRSDALNYLL